MQTIFIILITIPMIIKPTIHIKYNTNLKPKLHNFVLSFFIQNSQF